MSTSAYQWGNVRRSAFKFERWSWSLRWWLFVALVLAVLFHIWLFYFFNNLEIGRRYMPRQAQDKSRPERLAINPELMKQQQQAYQRIPDEIAPNQKEPQMKADITDIVDMLPPDKPLDLTPQVNKVTNFLSPNKNPQAASPAQSPSLASLADQLPSPNLANAASALKSATLNRAVSPNQMTIPTTSLEKELENADSKLLDRMHQKDAGNAASRTLPGYSNLDDLVARGSNVNASTVIAIPTDLLFDYGSDELAEQARLSLMKLGLLIMKNPNSNFIIEGHTDNFGTPQYNFDLSQRRANAVVRFLINLHLATDRVQPVGMGKTRLIVPDGSIEEQAPNRRVEIKVRPR